ncbi:hypothetical protein BH10PLA2_BH10PLA2_26840 [soil metagenome]
MNLKRVLIMTALAAMASLALPRTAHAQVRVGVSFGAGGYRPHYSSYYYRPGVRIGVGYAPAYYGAPVYVAPPPVVYAAPVYVQPTYVQPSPVYVTPPPLAAPAPAPAVAPVPGTLPAGTYLPPQPVPIR